MRELTHFEISKVSAGMDPVLAGYVLGTVSVLTVACIDLLYEFEGALITAFAVFLIIGYVT